MAQIRKMLDHEAEEVLKLWNENCLEAAYRVLSDSEAASVLFLLRQYLGWEHDLATYSLYEK